MGRAAFLPLFLRGGMTAAGERARLTARRGGGEVRPDFFPSAGERGRRRDLIDAAIEGGGEARGEDGADERGEDDTEVSGDDALD